MMQDREVTWSEGALAGIEKSEVGAKKGQWGVGPSACVGTIWDLSKQLAFSELALAVLAKTRTSEDSEPRPIKNGREPI
jgi:hypothetical protein